MAGREGAGWLREDGREPDRGLGQKRWPHGSQRPAQVGFRLTQPFHSQQAFPLMYIFDYVLIIWHATCRAITCLLIYHWKV